MTGCLAGSCHDALLMPPGDIPAHSGLTQTHMEVSSGVDAGTDNLDIALYGDRSDEGKTWSVHVVDSQGKVLVDGSGTVHHDEPDAGCPAPQQVSLP